MAAVALLLARAAPAEVIAPEAWSRAARDGSVPVVVALREAVAGNATRRSDRRRAIAAARGGVLATVASADLAVVHAYAAVAGFAADVTLNGLARLADHPDVLRVDVDPVATVAAVGVGVEAVRADRVQRRGVTGAGTTIAVIDTGIEAEHPDVVDALVGEACFCRAGRVHDQQRGPCCPDGTAIAAGPGSAAAEHPHGLHVAGVALSRGRIAPRGIAPDALLVAVRVLDADNFGFVSDWIAALDWLLAERPDVRVVNMSIVTEAAYAGDCAHCDDVPDCGAIRLLASAIGQLRQRGTLVFAASGNGGRRRAMTAPACVAGAVAVGAADEQGAVAEFSNTSPQLDLIGPGFAIESDGPDAGSAVMSGTSVAAPHAAGVAALLLSARPGLGAGEVERILSETGTAVVDPRTGRSTPRIDAFAALRATSRGAELERGSGSRATDCLIEWNVVPPDIVRRRPWPTAECRDGDPGCDADREPGRCTFVYSPCFNMRDPLLRHCAVNETLRTFAVHSPPVDAPAGSLDRLNVDTFASALPDFPFGGSDACSAPIPFIVARAAGRAGVGHLRVSVATATRRDYDHVMFRCLPP